MRRTEALSFVHANSQDWWYLLPSTVGQLYLEIFPFRLSYYLNAQAHSPKGDCFFALGKMVSNWIKSVFKSFWCHTWNKAFEKSKSWYDDSSVLWNYFDNFLLRQWVGHIQLPGQRNEEGLQSTIQWSTEKNHKGSNLHIYFLSASTTNISTS